MFSRAFGAHLMQAKHLRDHVQQAVIYPVFLALKAGCAAIADIFLPQKFLESYKIKRVLKKLPLAERSILSDKAAANGSDGQQKDFDYRRRTRRRRSSQL
jgi:hypothetical protein